MSVEDELASIGPIDSANNPPVSRAVIICSQNLSPLRRLELRVTNKVIRSGATSKINPRVLWATDKLT